MTEKINLIFYSSKEPIYNVDQVLFTLIKNAYLISGNKK